MSRIFFAALLLALLGAPGFSLEAQEKIKLRVSSATKTLGYGPLWIAANRGFFARQGSMWTWW